MDGAQSFLRGETVISNKKWSEMDGIIRFTVSSDGTTGKQWVSRLTEKGFFLDEEVKRLLNSEEFKPTVGTTANVIVVKGFMFKNRERNLRWVKLWGESRDFLPPSIETACLIREKFADWEIREMGLKWIVAMNKPPKGYGYDFGVFRSGPDGDLGEHLLCFNGPGMGFPTDTGFAFVQK